MVLRLLPNVSLSKWWKTFAHTLTMPCMLKEICWTFRWCANWRFRSPSSNSLSVYSARNASLYAASCSTRRPIPIGRSLGIKIARLQCVDERMYHNMVDQGRCHSLPTPGISDGKNVSHPLALGRKPFEQWATSRHSRLAQIGLPFGRGSCILERAAKRYLNGPQRRGN